jgi:hypothetical protein
MLFIIAEILVIPLFYLNLASIYNYLDEKDKRETLQLIEEDN